jgi:hypothetical protein
MLRPSAKSSFFLILPLLLLNGCGSGNRESGVTSATFAASAACMQCHASVLDQVTGVLLVSEWQASTHNTRNGASCADCHEPPVGHPNPFGPISTNPDRDQKCDRCHGPTATVKPVGSPHYNTVTTFPYPASYVSSQAVGRCRACHNPHDPTSAIAVNEQWAESAHAAVNDTPWRAEASHDWKTLGTPAPATPATNAKGAECVRCHTTTGFINYVTSGFIDIHAWGVASDKTSEILRCEACHDDGNGNAYDWSKRRTVGRITGYYNYSVTTVAGATPRKVLVNFLFPDVSTSNICMACHTGRESGRTIAAIVPFANFSTLSFVNSHYLSAGGTVFKSTGYEYAGKDYSNLTIYEHDKIGVANWEGTGTSGPCVGCHMSSPGKHTFLPVTKDATGTVLTLTSQLCTVCHGADDPAGPMNPAVLNAEKQGFNAALQALAKVLKNRGYVFSGVNPYFANKNWQTNKGATGGFGAGTGADTMGAAFNFNLLRHDFGGFAHNRFYVKRLIYDSIDWIDNGALDNSVDATFAGLATDADLTYGLNGEKVNFDTLQISKAQAYLTGGLGRP